MAALSPQRGALIVTGGGRGIGAATARAAAAAGYAVCVNYRQRDADAQSVVDAVERAGGHAVAVRADMAVEADILRMFETADRELGPLRALVNNAGTTGRSQRVADVDMANLRDVLDVNVAGYFLCAREAIRRMSTRRGGIGGAIVNVSSRAAVLGNAGEWIHYAASKAATDIMTIALAREVADEGIRVNAVRPGLIDTEIHAPERVQRLLATVPMGRIGSPDEVAATIVWLLSNDAPYVTGAIVDVSGAR